MDDIIYFFYENGFSIVAGVSIVKAILILLYRGFDLAYLFENFLVVYSEIGLEANQRRKRFRFLHNVLTIIFYIVLLVWLAVTGVVKYAR